MILLLLLCMIFNLSADQSTTIDHSITVFVHGTYPIPKILRNSPARRLMYCPQGLSLAKDLPDNYHFHTLAQGCVDLNSQLYTMDQFYIFGWNSEQVYDSVRKKAAANLVNELQQIVVRYYRQHGAHPKIRLIGFSHGGNVLLHTAHYLPLLVDDRVIDIELWLFGTPVQQINQDCVNSKKFSKVRSIYSKTDWLQRMDPQGLHDLNIIKNYFWSDRTFNESSRCVQVDFTVNGKSISHSYYRHIFKYFPLIQALIEEESQSIDSGLIAIDFKI